MNKSFSGFIKYRFLLYNLISRDIKVKYRRSVLGILWSVLNPLLMMLVMTAVFSNVFRFDIENFPVYYLTGSVMYAFFNEATNSSMYSVISSSSLIKKVYIPKYIFPLEKVMFSFVNMLFSLIAVIFIFLVTGTPIPITILLTPIPLIYIFVFALGFSMLLAALCVYLRDVLHLFSVLLTAWMYFTPIFYPVETLGDLAVLLNFNPLYHYITYFRNVAMYGVVPGISANLICIGFSIASLIIGILVFKKLQKNFVLYL